MYNPKRLKRHRTIIPPRGVRLSRKRKFQPIILTKSGTRVRSQYEEKCADYLYDNNIKYQYEPLILLDGQQYRPDFYLPDYKLFIEICGYDHMPFYNSRIEHKRSIYQKYNLQVAFIHYHGKGSLENIIKDALVNYGICIS